MPYGTPQSATFVMTVGKPQSAGDPMPNAFAAFLFATNERFGADDEKNRRIRADGCDAGAA